MSAAGALDDRVAAIVARFPGPVTLNVSKRRWLRFLAVGLAFAAIGGWMISLGPAGMTFIAGWGALVFFGLGSVVIVVTLLPGASGLTLDREGFVMRSLFRRSTYRWSDVDEFAVSEVPLGQGARTMKAAGFNDRSAAQGRIAQVNVALAGRNSALPDSYGLAVEDLVRLMSAWRLRALARRD
ncbi:MAG TPA: STM3941 family protein [Alphaproteobacteria bacterium]|nr:STM3941 family protein [Alphaproteobacteria bacterium]